MTKEKANRNEVVGMFLTYCRKTLVNSKALRTGRTCRSGKPYSMPPGSLSA